MNLFINNEQHKSLYKSEKEIKDINQNMSRSDPLLELLQEQQEINDSLYRSIRELEELSNRQIESQTKQWDVMTQQFKEFKKIHNRKNKRIVKKLLDVKAGNRKLRKQFKEIKLSEEKWISQLNSIQIANDELVAQLQQYALTSEQLEMKLNEQLSAKEHINEQSSESNPANTMKVDNIRLYKGKTTIHEQGKTCSPTAKENRKPSLRRKKMLGNMKQNKKHRLNKRFSNYPRIDDFS